MNCHWLKLVAKIDPRDERAKNAQRLHFEQENKLVSWTYGSGKKTNASTA